MEFKEWPVQINGWAFYAGGLRAPKVGFTLSPGARVSEYKAPQAALSRSEIQDGIDYELTRIEKGGLPNQRSSLANLRFASRP